MKRKRITPLAAIFVMLAFVGCGDGDSPTPTAPPPPPPAPSASIQIEGTGSISIHPSIDASFAVTIVYPMQIRETGGGTATWNFLRSSYFLNGVQVERSEVGSGEIRDSGFRDIAASSTIEGILTSRINTSNFDNIELLAGFSDKKDGRVFEVMVPFDSFDGVVIDLTPAVVPEGRQVTAR